uniref:Major facilitator superfamily (MFS) profile domain-containing protein n=1 Tax=Panagrolaimus davidi TaxID=227884 RepID=A0A914P1L8_9BILA
MTNEKNVSKTSAASNESKIVEIVEIIDHHLIASNISADEAEEPPEYSYTSKEQGWLFSAVAVGSFIGAIPLPFLTSFFGTRIIFTIYGTLSGLSMLLTPTAASVGYAALFLMRVFQGIAVATLLPTSGSIVHEWAAVAESGFAVAFLSCHQQLGQIFTMPIAGLFCETSFGWQGIYYLLGLMTLSGFGMFFFFFRDTARHHV